MAISPIQALTAVAQFAQIAAIYLTSAQDAPRDVQFNYDTIHLEVGRILIASGAIDLDTLISKVTAISGKISTISKIELPQRQFSVGTRST